MRAARIPPPRARSLSLIFSGFGSGGFGQPGHLIRSSTVRLLEGGFAPHPFNAVKVLGRGGWVVGGGYRARISRARLGALISDGLSPARTSRRCRARVAVFLAYE